MGKVLTASDGYLRNRSEASLEAWRKSLALVEFPGPLRNTLRETSKINKMVKDAFAGFRKLELPEPMVVKMKNALASAARNAIPNAAVDAIKLDLQRHGWLTLSHEADGKSLDLVIHRGEKNAPQLNVEVKSVKPGRDLIYFPGNECRLAADNPEAHITAVVRFDEQGQVWVSYAQFPFLSIPKNAVTQITFDVSDFLGASVPWNPIEDKLMDQASNAR
jgi:hypothetical protein